MFGIFKKDPIKKLEKEYLRIQEEAMRIQRTGDLRAYAEKITEGEAILTKMDEIRMKKK
jgi:hypothetical protein